MKSTRERILLTLATQPRTTINELAGSVGISAISVRHHLSNLEAEGLVSSEEERHGIGRPRLVYYLTEKGLERFPTRYYHLTNRILDQLRHSLPQAAIQGIFQKMAHEIAESYAQKARKLPMEKKLDLVQEALAQEGFIVEWKKNAAGFQIDELTCPFFHVGERHPEVCAVDQTVISTVLDIPVEKITCVLQGDAHCSYLIPNQGPLEQAA